MDMHGVTREDAVLYLLNIQDFVNLIVQHLKEGIQFSNLSFKKNFCCLFK